jgi:hypothetical protein
VYFFIAGIISAAVSIPLNRLLMNWLGNAAFVCAIPVVEETVKTVASIALHSNVVLTHVTFGIAEGLCDAWLSREPMSRKTRYAALSSIAAHSLFGFTHLVSNRLFLSNAVAFMSSVAMHVIWNSIVMLASTKNTV